MANTRWIAVLLKWVFAFFEILMGICAVAIVVVILLNPRFPVVSSTGNIHFEMMGLNGTATIAGSKVVATLANGGVTAHIDNAAGLFDVLKSYGLPLGLLYVAFYALLFDLLRRLFRAVLKGDSFTRGTVRMMQGIGLSLIIFSLLAMAAEGAFTFALFHYLQQHAVVAVSGAPLKLPELHQLSLQANSDSPFGSPYFFTGLLVLALSEVFRQGLALKAENDLTV